MDKYCTKRAAGCLRRALAAVHQVVVPAPPVVVPILRRFTGVYLYDGSVVGLPDALRDAWPGGGGGTRPERSLVKAARTVRQRALA